MIKFDSNSNKSRGLLDNSYTYVKEGQGWRQRSSKIPPTLYRGLYAYLMGHKLETAGVVSGAAVASFLFPAMLEIESAIAAYGVAWLTKKLMGAQEAGMETNSGPYGTVNLDYGKLKFFRQRNTDWHKESDGISGTKDKKDPKFDQDTGSHSVTDWTTKIYGATDSANVKSTLPPQFVFMDCGRWKGEARDFGFVWGRFAYLCHYEYKYDSETKLNNPIGSQEFSSFKCILDDEERKDRLDYQFFNFFEHSAMKGVCGEIKIQAYAISQYGEDSDYDWSKATVIIPDLHLMSYENAKVWYKWLSPGYYNLDAEVALLNFSEMLVKLGSDKLNVVQLGDSYDLWVGYGFDDSGNAGSNPLFKKNDSQAFAVRSDVKFNLPYIGTLPLDVTQGLTYMVGTVDRISYANLTDCKKTDLLTRSVAYKNWRQVLNANDALSSSLFYDGKTTPIPSASLFLNPAIVALRILEGSFAKMKYIYGNHDNYLISTELTSAAGLKNRTSFVEDGKSLFIEHAHRMEADFTFDGIPDALSKYVPRNHDGSWSGFQSTNDLFLEEYNWKSTDADETERSKNFENSKSDAADMWAGLDNQPFYEKKFAEFWMGRTSVGQKPYNIMVIGHTHMPALFNHHIEAPQPPPAPDQSKSDDAEVFQRTAVPVGDGLYMEDAFGSFR